MVVKFDKFIVIQAGHYDLEEVKKLITSSFSNIVDVDFQKAEKNNGEVLFRTSKLAQLFPVKFFHPNKKEGEATIRLTIPHVVIINFTQYGNKFLRVAHGDDLFKVLQETKKLIALAKRAHSKTDDIQTT